MTSQDGPSSDTVTPDGGTSQHRSTNYLDEEVNIFRPSTSFMRDHLKVIWGTFLLWALLVFGPVTATALAPTLLTETIVLGFQLHFFLTTIGTTLGALILSIVYAWQRDRLDDRYGITHGTQSSDSTAVAADGGDSE